jgi:hypothetical protein
MARKDHAMPIPRTPPGYKRTANLLHDMSKMYGSSALKDPHTRAKIRRKFGNELDIKQIDGEWRLCPKKKQTPLDK